MLKFGIHCLTFEMLSFVKCMEGKIKHALNWRAQGVKSDTRTTENLYPNSINQWLSSQVDGGRNFRVSQRRSKSKISIFILLEY